MPLNIKENLLSILDRVVRDNERCVVTTKSGNAVIVSEEAWNGLVETLCILSDPEMLSSMEEAESEYPDGCVERRECLKVGRRPIRGSAGPPRQGWLHPGYWPG